MTMTINHVHLGTKNLDASIDFYVQLFGFRKTLDHGSGVFLTNDAGFLIAIDPVAELPNLPTWYHLGLCLSSEDQVHLLHAKCRSRNVQIARELLQEPGQFASFYISDPDGYRIEISWHSE